MQSFELRADSAGAGKYRGGLGFRKTYRILSPCLLQTNLDRTKNPPWGVLGGKDAQPGCVTVIRGDTGEEEIVCKGKGYPLRAGDTVILETGGGGGYGPPAERDPDALARDLRLGYITREGAERDYGVRRS